MTAAKALFGFYVLNKDDTFFVKEGSSKEPLAQKWEQQARPAVIPRLGLHRARS